MDIRSDTVLNLSDALGLILQITGIGIISMVINEILEKSGYGQYKIYVNVLTTVAILGVVTFHVSRLFEYVKTMFYL
ncbi:MAG: hypothetical protein PWP27_605 [Clostridiales bacterium]|jgi:stage III sporulation protein AC|nr:hypothetical protein [Clostridiales bacterium]